MKRNIRKNVYVCLVLVLLFFNVLGYVNWVKSNWLPTPILENILISNLSNNWKGEEKPLFPPQTSWGSSFEYSIGLSSRWKPNAVCVGYWGGGQLSKLEQYVPFITFFIECQKKQNEKNYARPNDLHIEKLEIGDNSIELTLSYHLLDADTLKDIEKSTGKDNCIGFRASFSFQNHDYYIHGMFPLTGSEFSMNDSNVLQVREIVLQYINNMMSK